MASSYLSSNSYACSCQSRGQRDPLVHQPRRFKRSPFANRLDDWRGQQGQFRHPRDVDLGKVADSLGTKEQKSLAFADRDENESRWLPSKSGERGSNARSRFEPPVTFKLGDWEEPLLRPIVALGMKLARLRRSRARRRFRGWQQLVGVIMSRGCPAGFRPAVASGRSPRR